jgi:hypothetical protein
LLLSIPPNRYKFIKQGITVTGLGSSAFGDAIEATREIYKLQFSRQFADGKLESWNTTTYMGNPALDTSNRYLTPRKDAPNMVHVPFEESVDPRGILEEMAQAGHVHGEENVVQYFVQNIDREGNIR